MASKIQVQPLEEPLLKTKNGRKDVGHLISWPSVNLHAKPNPFLVCILKGTADLSVGVTDAMAKNFDDKNIKGVYQLRLQEKDILIQPSNVPTADGTKPHWEGTRESQPDSTILWIDIFAEGAILHTCHTVKGQHLLGPCRFVFNARLLLVMEAIIEELQTQLTSLSTAPISAEIVNSLLQVLFLRIYRSLIEQKTHEVIGRDAAHIVAQGVLSEPTEVSLSGSYALKRSCHFIQGRLGHPLSVRKIADYAFVSPAQLNRLFRAEMNQSVMEYVSEQRLNMAKALLINTTLPINIISENVGIVNPVYFSRMFRAKTGQTPREFRRNNR